MSQQQGLKVVSIVILAVSAVFGIFLAREAIDVVQGFTTWYVSDSYLHDAYLICKGALWLIGAGFAWKTVKTGLSFLYHEERRPVPVQQQQQQHPHQGGNSKPPQHQGQNQGQNHGNGNQNRLPQQQSQKQN
jgi:hypothetical protein